MAMEGLHRRLVTVLWPACRVREGNDSIVRYIVAGSRFHGLGWWELGAQRCGWWAQLSWKAGGERREDKWSPKTRGRPLELENAAL